MTEPPDALLLAALADSQRLGMLGRLPVTEVLRHSEAFVEAVRDVDDDVVDLGTGGGVPGLVIAWRRPDLRLVLVDRRATRTDHVSRLVHRLGMVARVRVLTCEAAALPRRLGGAGAGAVVARGYGSPARVVRDGAPLLAGGGLLVVSEPPSASPRWPSDLLAASGLEQVEQSDRRIAVFRRSA